MSDLSCSSAALGEQVAVFDSESFDLVFRVSCCRRGIKLHDLEEEIGEALCVATSIVRMWRYGRNYPSHPGEIEALEKCMGMPPGLFVKEKLGEEATLQYTERQLDAVGRIYSAVIEFMDEFERTNGFNDAWEPCVALVDPKEARLRVERHVKERHHAVILAGKKERFCLGGTELCGELMDFVSDDLPAV